jgi:glycine cleavage system H protein
MEVNESLNDSPDKVNEGPYGHGWIIKLRSSGEGDLLSAEEYEKLLEEVE